MDKRLDASRSYHEQDVPSHSKKSKKRSSKRNSNIAPWMSNAQSDQNNDMISGMEYSHVMWPPNIQQTFAANGRRLFTAASDPSVCGYTPMPLTYAMEPVSLPPMYRLYPSVPVPGIKTIPSGTRRQCQQNNPVNLGFNASTMTNGYASLQENGSDTPIHGNYQNGDYTSLPPTANKNNGINGDELSAEHRRYSDPGIGSAEAPIQAQSDDSDSVDSSSSVTTIGRSNKLVLSLIEQMTELKKSNSQLFKELNETKSELETVKVKLVQCKHNSSSDYQPGMLSDLIREIREANKACEEALVSKVKLMMEEKFNQKSAEIDKLNSQVLKLIKDKDESDRHVAKLEEEVATLKINANNEGREIAAFEEETLSLRRELQEARASRTLAENHAAKCVNAVARSVTPVSFESPSITSTPVRTAISDTCSLIPTITSSIPSNFTKIVRSRAAEVAAAHHFVPERSLPSLYRCTTDCSTISIESRKDPWILTKKTEQSTPIENSQIPEDINHQTEDLELNLEDISFPFNEISKKEDNNNKEDEDKNEMTSLCENTGNNLLEKSTEGQLESESVGSNSMRDANESKVDSMEGKDMDRSTMVSSSVLESGLSVPEKRSPSSRMLKEKKGEKCEGIGGGKNDEGTLKGSVKKGRRKRGNGSSKKTGNEMEVGRKNGRIEDNPMGSSSMKENLSKDVKRTVSEDEDCLDDDDTSRAITEIPEVTVVGGGSFVPKDLCSTGILTSRVLTAPSRATYTTTYI